MTDRPCPGRTGGGRGDACCPGVRSAAAVAIHALLDMRIACVSWVHFSPRSKCDGCGSSWASAGNKLPAPDSVSLDAEFSSRFSSESRNFCVWITHDRVSPRKARCQRPCKLSYLSTNPCPSGQVGEQVR